MPVLICHRHLRYNLLDVLVSCFNSAIHLRAKLRDHSVVEIGNIVHDKPFGDAIPTYKVMLNESGHNILGNGGK